MTRVGSITIILSCNVYRGVGVPYKCHRGAPSTVNRTRPLHGKRAGKQDQRLARLRFMTNSPTRRPLQVHHPRLTTSHTTTREALMCDAEPVAVGHKEWWWTVIELRIETQSTDTLSGFTARGQRLVCDPVAERRARQTTSPFVHYNVGSHVKSFVWKADTVDMPYRNER